MAIFNWLTKPDLNFNLKFVVCHGSNLFKKNQNNAISALKRDTVKGFMGKVKEPAFRKKVVINFRVSILSFELQTPFKDFKLMSVSFNKPPKKYPKYMKVPEVT